MFRNFIDHIVDSVVDMISAGQRVIEFEDVLAANPSSEISDAKYIDSYASILDGIRERGFVVMTDADYPPADYAIEVA